MTDQPICFIDCETTALGPLARPWEIAVIRRDPGEPDVEHVWHVAYSTETLPPGTNPDALTIGGWWKRGSDPNWLFTTHAGGEDGEQDDVVIGRGAEWAIAPLVHAVLDGAVLLGVGVHFDAAVLAAMFGRHGLSTEPWHYAIVDLKAATWGQLLVANGFAGVPQPEGLNLPMRSESLAGVLDVVPPLEEERHTALGDARWAARWFDALTAAAA